eukprot:8691805-Alexandrium_andersonii.AAC.1
MRGEDCEAMMRASGGQKIQLATFGGVVRAAELAASLTMCVAMLRRLRDDEDRAGLVTKGVRVMRGKGAPRVPFVL